MLRIAIIVLGVVGIGFAAFMLFGSNEQEPDPNAEPPPALAWLNSENGAPRLVEDEIAFPRSGGDSMGLTVARACGTPSRLAKLELTEGATVRIAYACQQSGAGDCRGPVALCEQVVCLVASEGLEGTSNCPSDREFVGEADLSIGPEGGRLQISVPAGETAAVILR